MVNILEIIVILTCLIKNSTCLNYFILNNKVHLWQLWKSINFVLHILCYKMKAVRRKTSISRLWGL